MDIERGIDGMIGRVLSWLVQAPIRLTAVAKESPTAVVKPEPSEAGATVAKRTPAKRTPAKKANARKAAPRRPVAKQLVAKKASTRKSVAKKPAAKKVTARKPAAKQPVARKAAARKPVAKTAPKPRARKKAATRAETLDAFVDAAEQAVPTVAGAVLEKADAPLDRFVESAERPSGGDDGLREQLLAALSASAEGATLAELHSKTGDTLANVRRQLNQLQESGQVQRGKGMGTRYHLS